MEKTIGKQLSKRTVEMFPEAEQEGFWRVCCLGQSAACSRVKGVLAYCAHACIWVQDHRCLPAVLQC